MCCSRLREPHEIDTVLDVRKLVKVNDEYAWRSLTTPAVALAHVWNLLHAATLAPAMAQP